MSESQGSGWERGDDGVFSMNPRQDYVVLGKQ